MDLDSDILRRTRAKTPCFFVGQLEKSAKPKGTTTAKELADQYQAELPLRISSPDPPSCPKTLRRTVRKMKGKQSLRDTLTYDRPYSSHRPYSSDAETLVGSDSPMSTNSRASSSSCYFPSKLSQKFREPTKSEEAAKNREEDHRDIGLRICLEMLTNELANALFKQHPVEPLDRASGLQIMLMIETYESVQQRIRQDIHRLQLANQNPDHVMACEDMLNTWIDALYALHDQAEASRPQITERPISISRLSSPSKLRQQAPSPESPDEFFDCEEIRQSPLSHSQDR